MSSLAWTLLYAHRPTEAEAVLRRALSFAPNADVVRFELATALLHQGKTLEAISQLEQSPGESIFHLCGLAIVYFAAGRKADSDAALAELAAKHPQDGAAWIAFAHAYRNEKDEAFKWIGIAYQEHERVWGLKAATVWNNLRGDPRYQDWLRKYKLA
jgi:predicted Zn-dependent protease